MSDLDLLDGLDDLPSMMSKLKAETPTKRFQDLGPNHSHDVSYALSGNDIRADTDSGQLAAKARAVIDQRDLVSAQRKTGTMRGTAENATLAARKLRALQANGVDLNKFYTQYDTQRTGCVSYRDFSDTLLAVSAGIAREDALLLAASLDKRKTGFIEYKNILQSLQQLKKESSSSNNNNNDRNNNNGSNKDSSQPHTQTQTQTQSQRDTAADERKECSSYSSSYLQMYQQRLAQAQSDPKAVVRVQSLSPSLPVPAMQSAANTAPAPSPAMEHVIAGLPSHSAKDREALRERAGVLSGRRFYYDERSTERDPALRSVTQRLKDRTMPFSVEATPDEQRHMRAVERETSREGERKRSSSAPPGAGMTLARSLIQPPPQQQEQTEKERETDRERELMRKVSEHSLKNALLKKESSASKQSTQQTQPKAQQTAAEIAKEQLKYAARRQELAKQSQAKVLENRVVRQLAGKLSALRHALRAQDMSRSGAVNLPEFRQALIKCGVDLSPRETEQLFGAFSSSNAPSGTVNSDSKSATCVGRNVDSRSEQIKASRYFSSSYRATEQASMTTSLRTSSLASSSSASLPASASAVAKIAPGYTRGQAVEIDAFVNRIQQRTTAPALSHVVEDVTTSLGEKVSDAADKREKARVIKKVLQSLSKAAVAEPKAILESAFSSTMSSSSLRQSLSSSALSSFATDTHASHAASEHAHTSTNTHTDSAASTGGWVSKDQLRETLRVSGVDLADNEFQVLLRTLQTKDSAHTAEAPRIHMQEMDTLLVNTLSQIEREHEQKRTETIRSNRRYGQTFASQIVFGEAGEEYAHILDSERLRKDALHWHKLKDTLQKNYSKVLEAFKTEDATNQVHSSLYNPHLNSKQRDMRHKTAETKNLTEIAWKELPQRLSRKGIQLSESDVKELQQHLQLSTETESAKDQRLSLGDFCAAVGIPVRLHNNNSERVELIDSHLNNVRDVGVFASSERSIAAVSKFHTSIFHETDESVHKAQFADRRRKVQPLSAYTKDPSKFWELVNSVDDPMRFPYPQPSCRPTSAQRGSNAHTHTSVREKSAMRGVISLAEHAAAKPRLTVHELMRRSESDRHTHTNAYISDDGRSISTKDEFNRTPRALRGGGNSKRANSAPARTYADSDDGNRSLSSTGSHFVIRGPQGLQASGQSARDDTSTDGLAASVQKWTNSSIGYHHDDNYNNNRNGSTSSSKNNNNNGGNSNTLADYLASSSGPGSAAKKVLRGGGGSARKTAAAAINTADDVGSSLHDAGTPHSLGSASTRNGAFSNPGTPRGRSMSLSGRMGLTGSAAAPFATDD